MTPTDGYISFLKNPKMCLSFYFPPFMCNYVFETFINSMIFLCVAKTVKLASERTSDCLLCPSSTASILVFFKKKFRLVLGVPKTTSRFGNSLEGHTQHSAYSHAQG